MTTTAIPNGRKFTTASTILVCRYLWPFMITLMIELTLFDMLRIIYVGIKSNVLFYDYLILLNYLGFDIFSVTDENLSIRQE